MRQRPATQAADIKVIQRTKSLARLDPSKV
jgi:hypothetical protein